MAWIFLIIADLLEVVWATGMKQSQGFTRLWPSIWTFAAMLVSFGLLALAMRSLPLGISYTVWVGIGAVGSILVGTFLFGERMTAVQLVCLVMIAGGIVGLKVFTRPPSTSAAPAAAGP